MTKGDWASEDFCLPPNMMPHARRKDTERKVSRQLPLYHLYVAQMGKEDVIFLDGQIINVLINIYKRQ
jgi:hypothetical protein